jgi:hypothetical protein
MGYPAVLLGLLGRACAIILGQMNRGALSASLRSSSHQSKSSADAFLRRMVALLITGRAQKPTLRTNPNVM